MHLVGILFPHINDDARSKSHQICLGDVISETGRKGKQTPWNTLLEKWIFAQLEVKREPVETSLYPCKGALQLEVHKNWRYPGRQRGFEL